MLSEKFSCCIDWTQTKITTKAYVYLDKKKQILRSSRHNNLQNQNNDGFFLENITQSKPFIKLFIPSSGSSLQIN